MRTPLLRLFLSLALTVGFIAGVVTTCHAQLIIAPDNCVAVKADCATPMIVNPRKSNSEVGADGTVVAECSALVPDAAQRKTAHCHDLKCIIMISGGQVSGVGEEVITKKGKVNLSCSGTTTPPAGVKK